MFRRILVPLDGSSRAEEVLPLAAHLARTSQAPLILVHVINPASYATMYPTNPVLPQELESDAESYLTQVAAYETLKGVHIETQVLIGSPVYELIIQFAQEQHVDLIVMRSHSETGLARMLLGSVAQHIARHSPIPVLILRADSSPTAISASVLARPPRVLVPLDGSPRAETVLLPAARLCAALASPRAGAIHLMRTVQLLPVVGDEGVERVEAMNNKALTEAEAYVRRIEQRFLTGDLASFHLTITSSVLTHWDAAEIWKRVIEQSECIGNVPGYTACDVIAMTTHGRHGLQHLLEGSVTESVFNATAHPLLVVHAPQAGTSEATTHSVADRSR